MKFDLTGIVMLVAGLLLVDHGVEGKPDPNSGGRTALQCYQCAAGNCNIQTCSAAEDACMTWKADTVIKACTTSAICNLKDISGVDLLAPLGEELQASLGEELQAPFGSDLLTSFGSGLLTSLGSQRSVNGTITCCKTNLCNKGTSAGPSVLPALLSMVLFCLLFI